MVNIAIHSLYPHSNKCLFYFILHIFYFTVFSFFFHCSKDHVLSQNEIWIYTKCPRKKKYDLFAITSTNNIKCVVHLWQYSTSTCPKLYTRNKCSIYKLYRVRRDQWDVTATTTCTNYAGNAIIKIYSSLCVRAPIREKKNKDQKHMCIKISNGR